MIHGWGLAPGWVVEVGGVSPAVGMIPVVLDELVIPELMTGKEVHHWPGCASMALRTSPLKLPTWTSTQWTLGAQLARREGAEPEPVLKAGDPSPPPLASPVS